MFGRICGSIGLTFTCALAGCQSGSSSFISDMSPSMQAFQPSVYPVDSSSRTGPVESARVAPVHSDDWLMAGSSSRSDERSTRLVASSVAADRTPTMTPRDIAQMAERGVGDDAILERIERSRVVFRLTAADENYLRDRGVSETVISAMKDTSRR